MNAIIKNKDSRLSFGTLQACIIDGIVSVHSGNVSVWIFKCSLSLDLVLLLNIWIIPLYYLFYFLMITIHF